MVFEKIRCPYCDSDDIVRNGKTKTGKQRYLCRNGACRQKTFQLEYRNKASQPGIKEKIIEMAMNGYGTRNTGRILGVSKDTVTAVLKKQKMFQTDK